MCVFFTSDDSISHRSYVQSHSTDSIIVSWDDVVNVVWARVSINDTDNWDT
ncbi:hypothetical protein MGSAQ_001558 [marine sediment metagenome]|uniref:Uncharacterized protein n=1 Tax=marine sediment metagenome TaxID=412755 RepID=A0A1B6NW14_9ZZZZ